MIVGTGRNNYLIYGGFTHVWYQNHNRNDRLWTDYNSFVSGSFGEVPGDSGPKSAAAPTSGAWGGRPAGTAGGHGEAAGEGEARIAVPVHECIPDSTDRKIERISPDRCLGQKLCDSQCVYRAYRQRTGAGWKRSQRWFESACGEWKGAGENLWGCCSFCRQREYRENIGKLCGKHVETGGKSRAGGNGETGVEASAAGRREK